MSVSDPDSESTPERPTWQGRDVLDVVADAEKRRRVGLDRWLGNITADVTFDPTISITAKAVYMVLSMHADKDGTCSPGRELIAKYLGCSQATVGRATSELERAAVVEKVVRFDGDGRQTSNLYILLDIRAVRDSRKRTRGAHQ